MHNRFVEGFVEPCSWGDTIDALSSRIEPGGAGIDSDTLTREAHAARGAAIRAALTAGWAALRGVAARLAGVAHPLRARFDGWRERRHAANELFALDDRTLAELGLRRAEIPFVVARPMPQRDQRRERQKSPLSQVSPIYFVK